jgi:aminomethyltransferase
MTEFQGWNVPLQFSDPADEHHAVRSAAGLFDVGFLGRIEVAGTGAEPMLQALFSRDVERLAEGMAVYGLFCTPSGGVIDTTLLFKLPSGRNRKRFLITTSAFATDRVLAWLEERRGKDVELTDRTAELAQLSVQGPFAGMVLEQLAGARYRKIKPRQVKDIFLRDVPVIVSRTGYTGERGYELFIPAGSASALWDSFLEAGRGYGLLPCGLACRDIARMEAGYVLVGYDVDDTRTPLESGLMKVVDLSKDFVGKEAILQRKTEGAKEKLVGYELFDKGIPKPGGTIFSENREIGTVTSGNHSYQRRRDVGLGYVRIRYAHPGQEIEVEVKDREIAAKIIELPLFRRK